MNDPKVWNILCPLDMPTRYYLKINNNYYTIVNPKASTSFVKYTRLPVGVCREPSIALRDIASFEEALKYLDVPPPRPVKGPNFLRTMPTKTAMSEFLHPDTRIRTKVYKWLETKQHSDVITLTRYVSLEAYAVLAEYGRMLAGFISF